MSAAWPFICPSCGSEFRYLNNVLQHAADIAALGFSRNSREHGVVKNLERAAFDNPAHGERKGNYILYSRQWFRNAAAIFLIYVFGSGFTATKIVASTGSSDPLLIPVNAGGSPGYTANPNENSKPPIAFTSGPLPPPTAIPDDNEPTAETLSTSSYTLNIFGYLPSDLTICSTSSAPSISKAYDETRILRGSSWLRFATSASPAKVNEYGGSQNALVSAIKSSRVVPRAIDASESENLMFCSSESRRGAILASNEMMVPRWLSAIQLSDLNKAILNNVSSTTPHITKWNARAFTDSQYFSASKIIPIPSNAAAATSASNNNGFANDKKSSDRIWGTIVGGCLLASGVVCALVAIRKTMRDQDNKEEYFKSILRRMYR